MGECAWNVQQVGGWVVGWVGDGSPCSGCLPLLGGGVVVVVVLLLVVWGWWCCCGCCFCCAGVAAAAAAVVVVVRAASALTSWCSLCRTVGTVSMLNCVLPSCFSSSLAFFFVVVALHPDCQQQTNQQRTNEHLAEVRDLRQRCDDAVRLGQDEAARWEAKLLEEEALHGRLRSEQDARYRASFADLADVLATQQAEVAEKHAAELQARLAEHEKALQQALGSAKHDHSEVVSC